MKADGNKNGLMGKDDAEFKKIADGSKEEVDRLLEKRKQILKETIDMQGDKFEKSGKEADKMRAIQHRKDVEADVPCL